MFHGHYEYDHDYAEELRGKWNEHVKNARIWTIVISIIMIIIGVLGFIYPADTFAFMLFLAAIALIVNGICEIVTFYQAPMFMRDPMAILNAVFSFLVALMLFASPIDLTASTLGIILALMLLSSGFEKLGFGWRLGFYTNESHGWLTFSAVLDIVCAVLFFLSPISGISTLGYILAAYLVVMGIALLIEGISLKPLKEND